MLRKKWLGVFVSVVAMSLVAGGAGAISDFTQAVSDDWMDGNNWTTGVPDTTTLADIGGMSSVYADVSSVIYAGASAEVDTLRIGYGVDGGLHVQATAGLTVGASDNIGSLLVGAYGDGAGTLVVDGSVYVYGAINIGGGTNGVAGDSDGWATFNSTSSVETYQAAGTVSGGRSMDSNMYVIGGNINIGEHNYMGRGSNYEVFHNDTTVTAGGIFYIAGFAGNTTTVYHLNGGTINANGQNNWAIDYKSFWHIGGTLEIAGDSEINTPIGFAIFGQNGTTNPKPILKFNGSAGSTLLNVTGEVRFGGEPVRFAGGDPNEYYPTGEYYEGVLVDVADLVVAPGVWTNIIETGSIAVGSQYRDIALVGTADPNWELRIDGSNVQVKYAGASVIPGDANLDGYVDDDDLSLLLSSWGQVADWANGEFSGSDPVNDDDLSILLTNWHVGTPPAAGELIPEPATMVLLGLGGIALIRKRR